MERLNTLDKTPDTWIFDDDDDDDDFFDNEELINMILADDCETTLARTYEPID